MIENTRRQFRQEIGYRREEDRGGFARNAPYRKDQPGDDVGHGHRQQYAADRLQFGGPECEAAEPVRVVDAAQRFFGGTDHDGQYEQCEGERSRYDRIAEAERIDEQRHAEQAEHDRRHAAEVVRHDADKFDEPVVARVLADIDAREDSQRAILKFQNPL